MEAGGWVNSFVSDGQATNQKCTTHTRHIAQVRNQVLVGLPWSRRFCTYGSLALMSQWVEGLKGACSLAAAVLF